MYNRLTNVSKYFPGVQTSLRYLKSNAGAAKVTDISKIRNVGIIAHIDAGKTTVTERILYYSGVNKVLGEVMSGNTVTDYMDQERERGISITSAAVNFMWKDHKINLIDTPGHIDFTCEVESALRVLDGAVLILDASAGVEAQTLCVWKQALKYNIPQVAFINKMDKKNASFKGSINSIAKKLGRKPLALQIPIFSKSNTFTGMVDLVKMLKCQWSNGGDGTIYQKRKLDPDQDKDLYEEAYWERISLLEEIANIDEIMGDHYLEDEFFSNLSEDEFMAAIKRITVSCQVLPVLCGSALKNKGIQRLLNSIVHYLPDPLHHKLPFMDEDLQDSKSGMMFAFKTTHNQKKKPITFLRIYSGEISTGTLLFNATRDCKEKVEGLYEVRADEFEPISRESCGNIVAVKGLNNTYTGDVLFTGTKNEMLETKDIPGIQVPEPVFYCSVEPPNVASQKVLDEALLCLSREDPSLKVKVDPTTGQTILCGMGELHMEIIKDRILREFKVDVDLGPIQIAYQECINSLKRVRVVHKLIYDERPHCIEVEASFYLADVIEKSKRKFTIVAERDSDLDKNGLRPQIVKAVEDGLSRGYSKGPLLGYPISNVHMELHDIKMSSKIPLPMISTCIVKCVKEAVSMDNAFLLQPIMDVEVSTSARTLGVVLSDLSQRDSIILSVEEVPGEDSSNISARTPLAKLTNFSTAIRTKTSGLASFNFTLKGYERVSDEVQEELLNNCRLSYL